MAPLNKVVARYLAGRKTTGGALAQYNSNRKELNLCPGASIDNLVNVKA